MGATARVIIDKSTNGGIFTNNDVVQGKAILEVTDSVTVSQVQLRFEGVSTATIKYNKIQSNNNRRVEVTNSHHVISYVTTVFPSEEESRVLTSSEFTLAAGTYEYPFYFKIPMTNMCLENVGQFGNRNTPDDYAKIQDHGTMWMNGMFTTERRPTSVYPTSSHVTGILPPSFDFGERAKVDYYVKLIVMKPSTFSRNVRAYDELLFRPMDVLEPPLPLEKYNLVHYVPNKRVNEQCFFRFQLNTPYVVVGQPIPASMFAGVENATKGTPTIYLDLVRIRLLQNTQLRSIKVGWSKGTMHTIGMPSETLLLYKECNKQPIELSPLEGQVRIPDDCFSCVIPPNTIPTFHTCNITRSYRLEITIGYSFTLNAKSGILAHLKGNKVNKVTILTDDILVRSGVNLVGPPPVVADFEELPRYEKDGKIHLAPEKAQDGIPTQS